MPISKTIILISDNYIFLKGAAYLFERSDYKTIFYFISDHKSKENKKEPLADVFSKSSKKDPFAIVVDLFSENILIFQYLEKILLNSYKIPIILLSKKENSIQFYKSLLNLESNKESLIYIWRELNFSTLINALEKIVNQKTVTRIKDLAPAEAALYHLANCIDNADPFSYGHIERVHYLADKIFKKWLEEKKIKDFSGNFINQIIFAHDFCRLEYPSKYFTNLLLKKKCNKCIKNQDYNLLAILDRIECIKPGIGHFYQYYKLNSFRQSFSPSFIEIIELLALIDAYDLYCSGNPWQKPLDHHQSIKNLEAEKMFPLDLIALLDRTVLHE